jgi:hypothetical protein
LWIDCPDGFHAAHEIEAPGKDRARRFSIEFGGARALT